MAGLGLALAAAGAASAQSEREIPVFVNGGRLESDALMLRNVGRTVLPMRTLFESLGARVEWDASQRAVYAWMGDGSGVRLGLGERSAQTLRMAAEPGPGNWGRITGSHALEAPAMLLNGRVFVPLRFASEALRADVRYAAHEPAVYIRPESVAGSREEEQPRPPRTPDPDREPPVVRLPRDRDDEPDIERSPRRLARALDLSIEVDEERVARGEPLSIRLVVKNRSNQPVVIPFRSGQRFDVEILQEEKVLWNWANGRNFTQALTSSTLEPGEEAVFVARWKMETNRGRRIPPGRYLVRGILTTSFREPQLIAEERITVTGER